eukprot:284819646_2
MSFLESLQFSICWSFRAIYACPVTSQSMSHSVRRGRNRASSTSSPLLPCLPESPPNCAALPVLYIRDWPTKQPGSSARITAQRGANRRSTPGASIYSGSFGGGFGSSQLCKGLVWGWFPASGFRSSNEPGPIGYSTDPNDLAALPDIRYNRSTNIRPDSFFCDSRIPKSCIAFLGRPPCVHRGSMDSISLPHSFNVGSWLVPDESLLSLFSSRVLLLTLWPSVFVAGQSCACLMGDVSPL